MSIVRAIKLGVKQHRCQQILTATRTQCTQVAKYRIGSPYYCTTHAKIRALKEILDDGS